MSLSKTTRMLLGELMKKSQKKRKNLTRSRPTRRILPWFLAFCSKSRSCFRKRNRKRLEFWGQTSEFTTFCSSATNLAIWEKSKDLLILPVFATRCSKMTQKPKRGTLNCAHMPLCPYPEIQAWLSGSSTRQLWSQSLATIGKRTILGVKCRKSRRRLKSWAKEIRTRQFGPKSRKTSNLFWEIGSQIISPRQISGTKHESILSNPRRFGQCWAMWLAWEIVTETTSWFTSWPERWHMSILTAFSRKEPDWRSQRSSHSDWRLILWTFLAFSKKRASFRSLVRWCCEFCAKTKATLSRFCTRSIMIRW